jgi:hypothetical protein
VIFFFQNGGSNSYFPISAAILNFWKNLFHSTYLRIRIFNIFLRKFWIFSGKTKTQFNQSSSFLACLGLEPRTFRAQSQRTKRPTDLSEKM